MTEKTPDAVTVVIPTIGRESLQASVDSALSQTHEHVEVVVVADLSADEPIALSWAHEPRVRVEYTGGGAGGAQARQLGTTLTKTPWVAYLDDDDTWFPKKIEGQLAAANEQDDPTMCVISCQSRSHDVESGEKQGPIPATPYVGSEPLSEWLFHRRKLSADRALMPTPTILVSTELALRAGWRKLPRHQDWDFLLRLEKLGADFVQVDETLVEFAVGSPASTSGGSEWKASLTWAEEMRGDWDDRTFADFVAGQPLRYALQGRDRRGVAASVRALPRLPTLSAVALALSGIAGRSTFDRLLHR